jgi:TIR domain
MAKIFISYRRQDSAGGAGRVRDWLVNRFGKEVFLDVDNIDLGVNFVKALREEVGKCNTLLAVIGRDWLDIRDKNGRRRLDDPNDFVRNEIGTALQRGIPVIPILLDGTEVPSADQLTEDLKELSFRNGMNVRYDSFETDMDRLVRGLKKQLRGGNWRDWFGSRASEGDAEGKTVPPAGVASKLITRRGLLATAGVTATGGLAVVGAYKLKDIVAAREIAGIAARDGPVAAISTIAGRSEIAQYSWDNRGAAPPGYIKGMAVVYARVYLKLKAGDAVAADMAKANTGDFDHDALAYYRDIFGAAGMSNAASGAATLRHLFVLLIGLGMRESGGRYCEGRDRSAANTTAESADAGLFQTTFQIMSVSPLLTELFNYYLANPSGFADVFDEGMACKPVDRANFGEGDGQKFQRLTKQCPAFAVEVAAVGLRHMYSHWGPIRRREAEVRPECDVMLRRVQDFADQWPNAYAALQ